MLKLLVAPPETALLRSLDHDLLLAAVVEDVLKVLGVQGAHHLAYAPGEQHAPPVVGPVGNWPSHDLLVAVQH